MKNNFPSPKCAWVHQSSTFARCFNLRPLGQRKWKWGFKTFLRPLSPLKIPLKKTCKASLWKMNHCVRLKCWSFPEGEKYSVPIHEWCEERIAYVAVEGNVFLTMCNDWYNNCWYYTGFRMHKCHQKAPPEEALCRSHGAGEGWKYCFRKALYCSRPSLHWCKSLPSNNNHWWNGNGITQSINQKVLYYTVQYCTV